MINKLEGFISWLDMVVEQMFETEEFNKEIEIKLDGKSLKLPLNADLYEKMKDILSEELKYQIDKQIDEDEKL